jgi:hypothetical protein
MDIGRKLADLEKRLERVEHSRRLSHAALDDTSLVVTDGTGTVRARIGMQADGTVGLIAVDGPAPGAPSPPIVTPTIGGLRVTWDGLLADGSPLPADFDHIAVHASTSSGFTPSAATYAGTITKAGNGGMLPLIPLPYQPHYIQLTAVNTSGNASAPSAETAATPIKVDGPDLEAGSVTAAAIQAGAVTAEKLEAILQLATRLVAGDPSGARVELNEDGLRVYNTSSELVIRFDSADGSAAFTGTITGSTVTGGLIRTAVTGPRITMNEGGENKILVYDGTRSVAGLSAFGLGLAGTNGALMLLDPNATFPAMRLTNAAGTNEAVINVSENTAGAADLGLNSGTFTGSGFTDMKWRTFFGNDFWVAERLRNSPPLTYIGGRIYLGPDTATIGLRNSTTPSEECYVGFHPGRAQLINGRMEIYATASASSALYVQGDAAHTGNLIRVFRDGADRLTVDKDGNTSIAGILASGNVAVGRITITPSASGVPTSGNVTGLNLKGSTIRVVATPVTAVPGTAVTGVGVTNQSPTGFTVWLTRNGTTTSTGIDWIAYGV